MKNHQHEPNIKSVWGMKNRPITDTPKRERILDKVNRIFTRIQEDELPRRTP